MAPSIKAITTSLVKIESSAASPYSRCPNGLHTTLALYGPQPPLPQAVSQLPPLHSCTIPEFVSDSLPLLSTSLIRPVEQPKGQWCASGKVSLYLQHYAHNNICGTYIIPCPVIGNSIEAKQILVSLVRSQALSC